MGFWCPKMTSTLIKGWGALLLLPPLLLLLLCSGAEAADAPCRDLSPWCSGLDRRRCSVLGDQCPVTCGYCVASGPPTVPSLSEDQSDFLGSYSANSPLREGSVYPPGGPGSVNSQGGRFENFPNPLDTRDPLRNVGYLPRFDAVDRPSRLSSVDPQRQLEVVSFPGKSPPPRPNTLSPQDPAKSTDQKASPSPALQQQPKASPYNRTLDAAPATGKGEKTQAVDERAIKAFIAECITAIDKYMVANKGTFDAFAEILVSITHSYLVKLNKDHNEYAKVRSQAPRLQDSSGLQLAEFASDLLLAYGRYDRDSSSSYNTFSEEHVFAYDNYIASEKRSSFFFRREIRKAYEKYLAVVGRPPRDFIDVAVNPEFGNQAAVSRVRNVGRLRLIPLLEMKLFEFVVDGYIKNHRKSLFRSESNDTSTTM